MGVFKLFQGTGHIEGLRVGSDNIQMFLADELLYQIPISGAAVTCSPSIVTYNGNFQSPTSVTVRLSGETLVEDVDYIVNNGTAIGGYDVAQYAFPVNGINYFKSYKHGYFTITKAAGSVTTAPSPNTLTYNGSSQTLVTAGSGTGTMLYRLGTSTSSWSTTRPTATDAGNYIVYYKASASTNYNESSVDSVSVTINKATGSVTSTPIAQSRVYDGSSVALVSAGSGTGTMLYSLNSTSSWSTTRPTAIDAGTYTVYYKASASTNYNESSVGNVSVTIDKADGSVTTVPRPNTLTFNNNAQTLVTAGSGTGTMQYRLGSSGSWSETRPTATNAGNYTVYYKASESANYNESSVGSVSVTINKANGSVTTAPSPNTLTYNNNPQTLVTAGNGTGTMLYSLNNTSSWSTTRPTAANAGNYTVYYKASASTNYYESSYNSVRVTIKKANGSVTTPPNPINSPYSRSQQTLLLTAGSGTGTMQYRLGTSGSWSSTIPTATNASAYTVYYKASESANYYESSVGNVRATISKVTPVVKSSPTLAGNWTYDASAHNLLYGGTMKHSSSNSTTVSGTFTYQQGTNVGRYRNPTWSFSPNDSTNYNSTNGSVTGTVTCNCKSCTAPTAKTGLTYNGSPKALVNAGSTSYGTMVYSTTSSSSGFGSSIPSGTTAGTYTVWWKVTGNTNVCCTGVSSFNVTIDKGTPSYTGPTAKTGLTYNGSSQTLYNAGSNSTPGSFSYSNGTRTEIGSQTVSWTFTPNDTDNYRTINNSFTGSIATNFKPSGSDELITSDSKYFAVQNS